MTGSTVQLESSNIQNILISLVVICAIVYGFIEFRKINIRLQQLEDMLSKMNNNSIKETSEPPLERNTDIEMDNVRDLPYKSNDVETTNVQESNEMINHIINQVEEENISKVRTSSLGGLFIAVNEVASPEINKVSDSDRIVELDVNDEPVSNTPVSNTPASYTPMDNTITITDDPIIEVTEKDQTTSTEESNYEECTIKELKSTLEDMGLSTSGNKTKLIERIVSNKN